MPSRRREQNQQLFRQVNQLISEIGASLETPTTKDPLEFVCECANASCTDLVPLTPDEYARVPRQGGYFLVKPGHEASDQRVALRAAAYVVVEDQVLVAGGGVSPRPPAQSSEFESVDG